MIRFRADVLGFRIPGSGHGYESGLGVVPYQARFWGFNLGLRWQCRVLIRFWADGLCFAAAGLGCILTQLLISLPDGRPVLITAGDVQGHEAAATRGGPELAAAFEPTLELGA